MAARLGARGPKKWQDSAGLILVSGSFRYARPPTRVSGLASGGNFPLIVPLDEPRECPWKLVLVKRNSKTGFYANNYVFPGGRLDRADSSQRWKGIFQQCSTTHSDPFHSILSFREISKYRRLPLYSEVPEGAMLGEIAFRICAIRELFEEAGVLLARDSHKAADIMDCLPGTFPPSVKSLPAADMNYWRDKVHSNAEEFLNLCLELQCVPDVWSLVEWSDWLTPQNLHMRYDTVFYLSFVTDQPSVNQDGEEIVDAKWFSPSNVLQQYLEKELLLSPPQFTEINLLRSLGSGPSLHSFALREMLRGSYYRKHPVRIVTKDKVVLSLLNQDDLYPYEEHRITKDASQLQSPSLAHSYLEHSQSPAHEYTCPTHTAEELRNLSVRLSRMEFHPTGEYLLFDNVISEVISQHKEDYDRVRVQLEHTHSKL